MKCAGEEASTGAGGLDLAAVYFLVRQPPAGIEVTIAPCTPRESLIHLIEHSLAAAPVAVLGWSARRLDQLSQLATQTPVKYLGYPGGNRWYLVRDAILNDLED
jgi:hypothetical protein